MFQYSLRNLMLAVTALSIVFAITLYLGVVGGSFLLFLLAVYSGSCFLSRRILTACEVIAILFALLPWLGVGGGVLEYPGSEALLPVVRWNVNNHFLATVRFCLSTAYDVAELPLHVLGHPALPFGNVVFFCGSQTIRPFMVFVFWGGLAIVLSAAMLSSSCRVRRETHNCAKKGSRCCKKEKGRV